MKQNPGDIGYLPAISVGTLSAFTLAWAAMHDIARGDGGIEHAALAVSMAAMALLYHYGMKCLESRERLWWLGGTGLAVALFNAAAIAAFTQPKFVADAKVGAAWLIAGLPALAWIGYRFIQQSATTRKTR